jgi:hypothetical protein
MNNYYNHPIKNNLQLHILGLIQLMSTQPCLTDEKNEEYFCEPLFLLSEFKN